MTLKLETVEISPKYYQVFVIIVVILIILHVQMILNKYNMVVDNVGTSNWYWYLN